jgi:SAM-dependent methyltransferase
MGEKDSTFAGSIPDIYDAYLVSLLFEAYASDLARRVAETDPADVLETAAGTGVVTRALVPLLSGDSHYAVTDLNQPMLDRAANRQSPKGPIVWRQADALNLPFKDASFDAVVCPFGAMFFPDRVAGYREARRVLKRGGRFLFDPRRFLARMPHGYHDLERIELELRTAGFSDVECATVQKRSEAPSPAIPRSGTARVRRCAPRSKHGTQRVWKRRPLGPPRRLRRRLDRERFREKYRLT